MTRPPLCTRRLLLPLLLSEVCERSVRLLRSKHNHATVSSSPSQKLSSRAVT